MIKDTLYNLNKKELTILYKACNNNKDTLAVALYNKGIVNSLDSGRKRAIKIINFI
jgi:hypothetical protein